MKDGAKLALGLGISAAIAGLIYAVTRAKAKPPPEGEAATIRIEIIGAACHFPATLLEGSPYTVRITITNASTKAGVPWEANFDIALLASTAKTTFIPSQRKTEYFAAGQKRVFEYPISVPLGSGGETGQVLVRIFDPAGNELAYKIEPITIQAVAIIYGATVTIGI